MRAAKGKRQKSSVSFVGPGRLGSVLIRAVSEAGWAVDSVVGRSGGTVPAKVRRLARQAGATVKVLGDGAIDGNCVWITVPDDAIEAVAKRLADEQDWKGKVVFHSSGALTSDALNPLRKKGASVASVHPGMTFPKGTAPSLRGVPFGIEGDATALRVARRIIGELGGKAVVIRKQDKVLYHAFDAFASPMVIALMASLEEVGRAAGIAPKDLRPMAGPLLRQTVDNYVKYGAEKAFTGPFVRGDVAVVRRHLKMLERIPQARGVYLALAQVAVERLPGKNTREMRKVLRESK